MHSHYEYDLRSKCRVDTASALRHVCVCHRRSAISARRDSLLYLLWLYLLWQRDLGPQLDAVLAACNGLGAAAAAFAPHVAALRSGGRINGAAADGGDSGEDGGENVASQAEFAAVWARVQQLAQGCDGLLRRAQEACSATTAHLDEHGGGKGGKGSGGGGGKGPGGGGGGKGSSGRGGGGAIQSRLPEIQSRQEMLGAARVALDAANEAPHYSLPYHYH